MSQRPVLRFGCAARLRGLLATLVVICGAVVWKMLPAWENEIVFLAGLPLLFLFLCLFAASVAVWNRYEVDSEGITKKSLLGRRRFRREDFITHELISERPGRPPSLLLRFRDGNLHLDGAQVSLPAERIAGFLASEWPSTLQGAANMPGEVEPEQICRYETLHASIALIAGVLLLALSIKVPLIWVGALLAALCFRLFWRTLGWIETGESGVTSRHRFRPAKHIPWNQIDAVEYWMSFSQGGVRIRGAGKTILVYRWIGNYPRFSRLLHDRVPEDRFSPMLHLPMAVPMNGAQRYGAAASVMLVAANAVPFLIEGDPMLYAGFVAIPAIGGLLANLLSIRRLEIDRNEIRDVSILFGIRTVTRFQRSALLDARLGRQISAGGLWLKFTHCRLEISNRDASRPPEQILACLRREWAWESRPAAEQNEPPDRLTLAG